jgi:hypothetical protein
MLNKLEEFKQLGLANVQLHWGDEYGLDQAVPLLERAVRLTGVPTEFYGKAKLLWAGRAADLSAARFDKPPEVLPYPLRRGDIVRAETQGGWFVWGTPEAVKRILERYKER